MLRRHTPSQSGVVARKPLRLAAFGSMAIVIVALVITALLFSNSFAARQATDDAVVLYRAEATLGTTHLAVKALSQAVLLSEDLALGVADQTSSNAAIAEAHRVLGDLEMASDQLAELLPSNSDLAQSATEAIEEAGVVLELLESSRASDASAALAGPARDALTTLSDASTVLRDDAAADVTTTADFMSRLGNLPAFLVAFLIPGLAILGYRRIAKNQLRLAEVQLDARLDSERQLVEAKDEFVANISHELRTPLTSIYGFSEMLIEQGLIDPEQAMELITVINEESAELHRMVEDLLTSARHEAGTLSVDLGTVDISRELTAAAASVTRADKGMNVELKAPTAWADGARVRHILRNLLSNARRYGGERILVGSERVNGHVEITVADNGPGVTAEKKTRLFTRYVHEGKDPLTVGSVGLGLANVKILAEAMGGSVIYQRDNSWTQFTLRLPATEDSCDTSLESTGPGGTLPMHLVGTAPAPAPADQPGSASGASTGVA